MATRAERRRERYERIVKATNNPTLAREYRDRSIARISADLGIDVSRETRKRRVTVNRWGGWSNPKDKREFPTDVVFYATQKNRELGLDDNDTYGYAFAFRRIVKGEGEPTIQRTLIYDFQNQVLVQSELIRVEEAT